MRPAHATDAARLRLFAAVVANDLPRVQRLVQQNVSLVVLRGDYTERGRKLKLDVTVVELAVWVGHIDQLEWFLAIPTMVDYLNTSPVGKNALREAIAHDRGDLVAVLVRGGISVHTEMETFKPRLEEQTTPLMYSIRQGKLNSMLALLECGADVLRGSTSKETGGPCRNCISALWMAPWLRLPFEIAVQKRLDETLAALLDFEPRFENTEAALCIYGMLDVSWLIPTNWDTFAEDWAPTFENVCSEWD